MARRERSGEAIGEGAASVALEAPGLKVSCREVEAWHHEESPGEPTVDSAARLH